MGRTYRCHRPGRRREPRPNRQFTSTDFHLHAYAKPSCLFKLQLGLTLIFSNRSCLAGWNPTLRSGSLERSKTSASSHTGYCNPSKSVWKVRISFLSDPPVYNDDDGCFPWDSQERGMFGNGVQIDMQNNVAWPKLMTYRLETNQEIGR